MDMQSRRMESIKDQKVRAKGDLFAIITISEKMAKISVLGKSD